MDNQTHPQPLPKLSTYETTTTETPSPTRSDDLLLEDAPGYITPDQQDMLFTDITSDLLHSNQCTIGIGRGMKYLSVPWPATGVIYGYNNRLMVNLPCRRARPDRGYKVLNVYFLLDTACPCSYLCREAMDALIGRPGPGTPLSEQLRVVVQNEAFQMAFYMSPVGTADAPGKFKDVNVLGMDFLVQANLTMSLDTPIHRFKLSQKDFDTMYGEYPDDEW
mmetsp:Transcript_35538/g.85984  ORF Transcript_35538/g.85984 Transcript_35538/m.85984 type:complete len:220 (+) Transcript_35538:52-711(+)